MKIVCVAAARSNFMKIKPIVGALEALGIDTVLLHTCQHFDPYMSDVFFSDLRLRAPHIHLGVHSGSHAEQTSRVMVGYEQIAERLEPDVTLVVGDVDASLACALSSAKVAIPVAHVESGLRSRDWEMPEEVNRVVVDRLSDWLFATATGCSRRRPMQPTTWQLKAIDLIRSILSAT